MTFFDGEVYCSCDFSLLSPMTCVKTQPTASCSAPTTLGVLLLVCGASFSPDASRPYGSAHTLSVLGCMRTWPCSRTSVCSVFFFGVAARNPTGEASMRLLHCANWPMSPLHQRYILAFGVSWDLSERLNSILGAQFFYFCCAKTAYTRAAPSPGQAHTFTDTPTHIQALQPGPRLTKPAPITV